jgi:hypothetical protein
MNQAHKQVTHPSALLGLIEQSILPVENGFLQGPLNNV